jgi:Polyketide cyclase / dehydrase and lipid transport
MMKLIRRILTIAGFLILAAAVVSLLLPGSYRIKSSALIDAPASLVFQRISDFQRWKMWNSWDQGNSSAITSNPSSGLDAWREWKNSPQGYAKATGTYQEGEREFFYRLLFGDHGVVGIGAFDLQPEGNGTRVSWTFSDRVGMNPIKRWFALTYSFKAGAELDNGLANLKKVCEQARVN